MNIQVRTTSDGLLFLPQNDYNSVFHMNHMIICLPNMITLVSHFSVELAMCYISLSMFIHHRIVIGRHHFCGYPGNGCGRAV